MLQYSLDISSASYSYPLPIESYQQKLPFYVNNIGFFDAGEKYYTTRDGLQDYLLIITTDGAGQMFWKKEKVCLEAGSAVLIHCDSYHDYRTLPKNRWKFFFIHFNGLSLEGYRMPLLEKLTRVSLRSAEYAYEQMKKMCSLAQQNDVVTSAIRSHLVSALLTEMVCSLVEEQSGNDSFHRKDIAELAQYIRQNCHQDMHVDDFIRISKLSRHYLIHLFQRQMGMAPYRYMHMCRIQQAQLLLQNTDYTVAKIADDVGYQTMAAFVRQFRSFTGTTPGEYRQRSLRRL